MYSNRVDVQDALNVIAGDVPVTQEEAKQAHIILRNYIATLEQQARDVIRQHDNGTPNRAWESINALRATINYPRRQHGKTFKGKTAKK